ncbi:hypothetical protein HZH66_007245 [Vespula vulgaris]|uniref:Uncharacterized protein n=1 Tax=Vespula vulgaris TaxID=7454 RepID=A0A834JXC5_VESVU|nr:hypothetical protein HZH66_007245 [Vespula vulgaris]
MAEGDEDDDGGDGGGGSDSGDVGNSVIGSGTKGKEGLCASWHSDAPVAMIVIEWRLADRPRSCLHSTRFGRKCGQRYGLTKGDDHHPFLSGSPVKFCSTRRTKVDPKNPHGISSSIVESLWGLGRRSMIMKVCGFPTLERGETWGLDVFYLRSYGFLLPLRRDVPTLAAAAAVAVTVAVAAAVIYLPSSYLFRVCLPRPFRILPL